MLDELFVLRVHLLISFSSPSSNDKATRVTRSARVPSIYIKTIFQSTPGFLSYCSEETHLICRQEDPQDIVTMAGLKWICMFVLLGLLCLALEVEETAAQP